MRVSEDDFGERWERAFGKRRRAPKRLSARELRDALDNAVEEPRDSSSNNETSLEEA